MDEGIREYIRELMGTVSCRKDFECADKGFEQLCLARDIGLDKHLECLDPDVACCSFALTYGEGYYCRCPIRVYLGKHVQSQGDAGPLPRDA